VRQAIDNFQTAHFSAGLLDRVTESIQRLPALQRIVLLGFGEALCHPNITEVLTKLSRTGKQIVLVTNGHLLTPAISDLLVSLPVHALYFSWDDTVRDGITDAGIRVGADLAKILKQVAALQQIKKTALKKFPELGLEIVALKRNRHFISDIIRFWRQQGINRFVVTHLFPYRAEVASDVLYDDPATTNLRRSLARGQRLNSKIVAADQFPEGKRICPFIERGSLFVRVDGKVAPCPELAYTHDAYYWGQRRPHLARSWGDLNTALLDQVWQQAEFKALRRQFAGYFFPDCVNCYQPEMCAHRMGEDGDCSLNGVPCGECLWSRGLIRCP